MAHRDTEHDLIGPVHVVGAGLLGTSVGLALSRAGETVWVSDVHDDNVRTAAGLGAGVALPEGAEPALVVVAVPPSVVGVEVVRALSAAPRAVVTDVGSVKAQPLAEVLSAVPEHVARYVGGHPMAGSERSGPLAASASLFEGRPWAVTPHPRAEEGGVRVVERLATTCGAVPVALTPEQHDRAVARTSHLPHLMSVLTAARLAGAEPAELSLSGQGVRDVTRIAASDPVLWQQIIVGNAGSVRELLVDVRRDLDALIGELDDPAALAVHLRRGNDGVAEIPGKHGGEAVPVEVVTVSVPDHPGELARLFGDVSAIGTNIEDLRIDHDPGRPVGLVELHVAQRSAAGLRDALEARHWAVQR
ncbi:prephenate dehydrogenase [Marmoricola endophyticus]|uniref:Prephenate dehydrogenase n=1 Tax=Marmoricola endophyticus TaxID=2040280 RepID=A0A917BC98_9ACTN|nr:prephenate dehydrogenase [Marmoricola endophyticus]GGF35177.1 prephenate dehydrogenase [Marmoricola endophyticus]